MAAGLAAAAGTTVEVDTWECAVSRRPKTRFSLASIVDTDAEPGKRWAVALRKGVRGDSIIDRRPLLKSPRPLFKSRPEWEDASVAAGKKGGLAGVVVEVVVTATGTAGKEAMG